jgi:hypothetical protein
MIFKYTDIFVIIRWFIMDKRKDPYSPGAGRPPFALAGRADDIDEFEAAIARIEDGMDARPLVFYGLRGVGKTVLLRDFQKRAVANGWLTAFVEANPEKSLRARTATTHATTP